MLTLRQEEILHFIREHQERHQVPPSTRDIQRQFGFKSQNAVMCHLRALAAKGAVEQQLYGAWGIRVTELQGLLTLPVYGTIPAGRPSEEAQDIEETVRVDPAVFGVSPAAARQLWGLRIKGDSMIGAQLCPGDLGIFARREARPGDIIAALVDGVTTTLKRLVLVDGRAVLRAANPSYPDIVPTEGLEAQGVLIGLLRRLDP